jgi:hypothetical protein
MYQQLFNRLLGGETLTDICKSPNMPGLDTVFLWLSSDNEECIPFQIEYRKFRQFQRELLVEEMLQVAKNEGKDYFYTKTTNGTHKTGINRQHFQRCKLRVDTIREALKQLNAMDLTTRHIQKSKDNSSRSNPPVPLKSEGNINSPAIPLSNENIGSSLHADIEEKNNSNSSTSDLQANCPGASGSTSNTTTILSRKLRRARELEARRAGRKKMKAGRTQTELVPA